MNQKFCIPILFLLLFSLSTCEITVPLPFPENLKVNDQKLDEVFKVIQASDRIKKGFSNIERAKIPYDIDYFEIKKFSSQAKYNFQITIMHRPSRYINKTQTLYFNGTLNKPVLIAEEEKTLGPEKFKSDEKNLNEFFKMTYQKIVLFEDIPLNQLFITYQGNNETIKNIEELNLKVMNDFVLKWQDRNKELNYKQ